MSTDRHREGAELLLNPGERNPTPSAWKRFRYALRARLQKWTFLLFFVLLGVGAVLIFIVDLILTNQKAPSDITFILAHSFAQLTKYAGALILLPVSSNVLTWLRSTALAFTSYVAASCLSRALVTPLLGTGGAWFVPYPFVPEFQEIDTPSINSCSVLGYDQTFGLRTTKIDSPFPELVTGNICLLLLIVIAIFSLDVVKRANFECFYFVHWTWVLYMIMMIAHGLNFWMWCIGPLCLYAVHYAMRARRRIFDIREVEACVLPGGVMQIEFRRGDLKFKAGQFVLLNCPEVSRYEWHPFTISSSPDDFFVTIHMKILGDWTEGVQKHLSPVMLTGYNRLNSTKVKGPRVFRVDGPYGAPAEGYTSHDAVVFVGAGIGNTPFVSVLRHLKNQIAAREKHMRAAADLEAGHAGTAVSRNVPEDGDGTGESIDLSADFRVKRIYFVSICADEAALLWFSDVSACLTQFPPGFLKMYLFLTHVPSPQAAIAAGIARASEQDFGLPRHESGMVPKLQYGRPDFDKVMFKVASKEPSGARVGVYFCGPRTPGQLCRDACINASEHSHTTFLFHKENF